MTEEPIYLGMNANNKESVVDYYRTRARQMMGAGAQWSGVVDSKMTDGLPWFYTQFMLDDTDYCSVYIPADSRGHGLLRKIGPTLPHPILTIPSCEVATVLQRVGIPHRVLPDGWLNSTEWRRIHTFYGSKRAKRSGQFLMNHIDEGASIIQLLQHDLGLTDEETDIAIRAYMIHPMLQGDDEYVENAGWLCYSARTIDEQKVFLAALEYRKTAMAYLSKHDYPTTTGIELSPMRIVNAMLVADKLQNYKDFIKYHRGTHARSDRLEEYFNQWLTRLGGYFKDDENAWKQWLFDVYCKNPV